MKRWLYVPIVALWGVLIGLAIALYLLSAGLQWLASLIEGET